VEAAVSADFLPLALAVLADATDEEDDDEEEEDEEDEGEASADLRCLGNGLGFSGGAIPCAAAAAQAARHGASRSFVRALRLFRFSLSFVASSINFVSKYELRTSLRPPASRR